MFDLLCAGADECLHTLHRGADFVVRRAAADYLRPAKYGDDLIVRSSFSGIGKTSLDVLQEITRGGETIVRLKTKLVYVDIAAMRPARVPEFWLERIKNVP